MPRELTPDERGLVEGTCKQVGSCFAAIIDYCKHDSVNNEERLVEEFGKLGGRIADIAEQ